MPRKLPRAASLAGFRLVVGAFLALALGSTASESPAESPSAAPLPVTAFHLRVAEDGVYAVTFEDLEQVAGTLAPQLSRGLALTHRGEAVPIWVEDGGDGVWGPGDRLEFLGRHLPGEHTHFHEQTSLNSYRLSLVEESGARMVGVDAAPAPKTRRQWRALEVDAHLERDRLRLRFAGEAGAGRPALWYWQKLTHLDRPPFRLELDLRDYDPKAGRPLEIDIALRGWSKPQRQPEDPSDHRIEAYLGETLLGFGEWNGQEAHRLRLRLDPDEVPAGRARLRLVVPKRRPDPEAPPKIDVMMLDWVRLAYPRRTRLDAAQERFDTEPSEDTEVAVPFSTEPGRKVVLYGHEGRRIGDEGITTIPGEKVDLHLVARSALSSSMFAVLDGQWQRPAEIAVDHPSQLRDRTRQADYLMITHPRLREAIEPLAKLHRQRGLAVTVIEVDEIYDEFNHGIVDADALRQFLAFAYHQWTPPAPRFVLLVGDASWDTRNEEADDALYADWTYRPGEKLRFVKNSSTAYRDDATDLPHRDLIPTSSFETSEGHAASDNHFVAVAGEDALPDLAIGRLPVTEPEEVAAIVAKTQRYLENAGVGPWRRHVLWITNEERTYQHRSERISRELALRGFTADKVYPSSQETSNAEHRETLRTAFDSGQLLVHFYGHGGRYIWRTGPPDLKKNHDLFTLDDLETLEPNPRLPMVLSMSCYSAPFDHPTADSIGEKFLRLNDRGAIAVLAASWRNSPSLRFSRLLLGELTSGGTVGEAVLRAKREVGNQGMVEMYNLLGDPAVELAVPGQGLELTIAPAASATTPPTLEAHWGERLEGRALVEWMRGNGDVVGSREVTVEGTTLSIEQPIEADGARWARVYLWDESRQRDLLASVAWKPQAVASNEPSTAMNSTAMTSTAMTSTGTHPEVSESSETLQTTTGDTAQDTTKEKRP